MLSLRQNQHTAQLIGMRPNYGAEHLRLFFFNYLSCNFSHMYSFTFSSRHSSSQLQLNSVMSNFQKATQLSQIMASRQRQALEKLAMRDSHYVELD